MAFVNQIGFVSVVKSCLIEQVFVLKLMPYERQLKERQVYKTLSICVEFIKSDVNLKFRLKVSSNVIYRRCFFKESNIRTVPCAHATPTCKGLLENLMQFIINRQETEKGHFNVI